jgi:hypothetical protein
LKNGRQSEDELTVRRRIGNQKKSWQLKEELAIKRRVDSFEKKRVGSPNKSLQEEVPQ